MRCPLFLHFPHLSVEVGWGPGCMWSVLSLHMALASTPSTEKGVGTLGIGHQALSQSLRPSLGGEPRTLSLHSSWAGTSQVVCPACFTRTQACPCATQDPGTEVFEIPTPQRSITSDPVSQLLHATPSRLGVPPPAQQAWSAPPTPAGLECPSHLRLFAFCIRMRDSRPQIGSRGGPGHSAVCWHAPWADTSPHSPRAEANFCLSLPEHQRLAGMPLWWSWTVR